MSLTTRNTSDRNPSAAGAPVPPPVGEPGQTGESLSALMASLPEPDVIARLANEFFAALPGHPSSPEGAMSSAPLATPMGSLPATPVVPPAAGFAPLTEEELRALPATLAGATAIPPQAAFNPPTSVPSGSSFYFFDAAQPTSPGGIPGAQVPPGAALASAPPALPPVEVGSWPAAPTTSSAAIFPAPTEGEIRPLNTTLANAAGLPPQAAFNPPTSVPTGSSFYFFDGAQPTSPGGVPGAQVPPGAALASAPPATRPVRRGFVASRCGCAPGGRFPDTYRS